MARLNAFAMGLARALGALLRGLWRSFGAGGSLLTGLCLLIVLSLIYFLGTEQGRVSLTRTAFYGAEQVIDGLSIEAEGIGSERLGAWFFERLRVDFESNTLAEGYQLELELQSFSSNPVNIDRVVVKDFLLNIDVLDELLKSLARAEEKTAQDLQEEAGNREATTWETLVPRFRLGELRLERLQLISSKITDIPAISVYGNSLYRWEGQPTQLQLEIRELSGGDLQFIADGRERQPGRFVLDFSASEKAQGFVGRQLHLPQGQGLDARGKISLRRRDKQIQVDIESLSTPFSQHKLALTGSLVFDLFPWRVHTDGIWLQVDGKRSTLSGNISADNISAELHLNRLPITLSRPWQNVLHSGWFSAGLTVSGTLPLPDISGQVKLNSSYREQPLELIGEVNTIQGMIHLESLWLEFAGAQMRTAGSIDTENKTLDMSAAVQELGVEEIRRLLFSLPQTEQLKIPDDFSGTLHQLQLTAQGPWDNPDLQGDLSAVSVYRNLQNELTARVNGNLKGLTITDFSLVGDKLNILGGGTVDIESEALNLQLQVDIRNLNPSEDLGLASAKGVSLGLQGQVGVEGPWSNPRLNTSLESDGLVHEYRYNLKGDASGDLEKINLQGLRVELYANGSIDHFDMGQFRGPQSPTTIPSMQKGASQPEQNASRLTELAKEAQRLGREGIALIEAEGALEPKLGRLELGVSARNLPLPLFEVLGLPLPKTLEGELSLDGEIKGALTNPEVRASVLAQGGYRHEPWQLQGVLDYADKSLVVDGLEFLWAGRNQLWAHGSLNEQRLDLQLQGRASLEDLSRELPFNTPEQGDVVLYSSITGSPRQPQLEGELRISGYTPGREQGRVQVQPLSTVLEWHTEGGELQVSLVAEHDGRRAIDSSAKLLISPIFERLFSDSSAGSVSDIPLQLVSSGSADLSVVAEFIDPRIHVMRGLLSFSADGVGTLGEPHLVGGIELSGASYEHRPSHTRITNIDFYTRLTPGKWLVERGSATVVDGGTISLGGAVFFPEQAPPQMSLSLNLNRAHLLNTPGVRGAISGEATLSGSTEDAQITGRFTLRPLAVQIEQWIGSTVPEIQVVEVQVDGPQVERAPLLLSKISLGVEVILDQQSYVRGLGLNSQLRGQVDIHGTAAKPEASGELTIVRGSFDLLGKKFNLQEGEIRFENNEVAVFVEGVYSYRDGEITANISGSATDLDITFSSDPSASQDEILAQLLFGKSLSDISPLQAVRLVSVVRSLQTGRAVLDPVAKTRELLRLDTLNIEQEEGDEGEEYALSLGKYITNRIYVELQRSTDPLSPWQAEMQIELRENLNLEFKTADDGDSGSGSVELQWKKDY
ncbi:translocation/assembly module TamB domain-containing protein [Microbulbifer variabilis]|uniref:translocation/assembly module TamB domain-containing protein n=1 Tax=Microbulbifer variabilis TaxID=266805 RepID=UPI0003609462|nr:translocation/assembly module TamB [Microbulbifer variabilis]